MTCNNGSQYPDIENQSYEEAFSALEEVITALESGEQPLENALALYEQGKTLAEHCSKLLDQAELRVKLVSGDEITDFSIQE
jgi:exodeoxyribonuclease VII small subunit